MISIECYNGLPVEYESFLIDKYDSFITTCRYIEIYYPTHDINYMLVYEDSKLIDLLVFGNSGKTSTCFNSLTNIDQNILTECSKKFFEQYSSIRKIKIVASYKNYVLKKTFLYCKSDDQILNLPTTIDDFYTELGPKTRKHIKQRNDKLKKEFPTVNYVTKYGDEIDEIIIDKIIQFNRERMKGKGKLPGIDKVFQSNMYKYSQHYGCVTYIEIDGVMVAGTISTVLNNAVFLHVIAHNNYYCKFNVGELCAFHTIQNSIEKGLLTMHFLWGESELKKRFLAKPNILLSYYIFRRYSLNYFITRLIAMYHLVLKYFKNSKFSNPFRKSIEFYRKKTERITHTFEQKRQLQNN